jgi:hypothetical protein
MTTHRRRRAIARGLIAQMLTISFLWNASAAAAQDAQPARPVRADSPRDSRMREQGAAPPEGSPVIVWVNPGWEADSTPDELRLSVVVRDPQTGPHVRTEDPRLSKIIRQGQDQSPTFRELVNRIDRLSGFVYVVWSRCGTRQGEPDACLDHRLSVSGGIRFLRVNIYPGASGERLLALIAHELQHALEVLSDDSVTSQEEVEKLYERIGIRGAAGNFETAAAQGVQGAVYREARERAR